jgi:hypothetical protein
MSFKAVIQQLQLSCPSACLIQTEALRYIAEKFLKLESFPTHRCVLLLLRFFSCWQEAFSHTVHARVDQLNVCVYVITYTHLGAVPSAFMRIIFEPD